jgi:hypothetical protein
MAAKHPQKKKRKNAMISLSILKKREPNTIKWEKQQLV